jgi:glycine cleavage system regulatory protein
MKDLVLTLIGPDRPGLVESLAKRVAAHGGNWLESRMAQLAGQFAGILRVEVPSAAVPALQAALAELEAEGIRVVAESGAAPADSGLRPMELQLVGHDHPGIVRDVSQVLLQHGVNIEELTTDNLSAPMSGGLLFSARARLRVPTRADTDGLRRDLEKIADDLMVDLTLAQAVIGQSPPRR